MTNALNWELWDTATIAARMKYTRRYVEENVVNRPDFPLPVRVTDGGKPRWIAHEVIAYVEARPRAA